MLRGVFFIEVKDMSDFTFELLKVIVMAVVIVITRYLVPYLQTVVKAEQVAEVQGWVEQTVLMVQQVYGAEPGEERKKMVIALVESILNEKGIQMTGEQINILIEAAVKQMKMAEGR